MARLERLETLLERENGWMTTPAIEGTIAPGFERVRHAFARNFEEGLEVGASFAVLRDGEAVVDLWGGYRDRERSRPWTEDTLINVYSTTKGMTALCAAILVDRGELDYGARMTDYWPEFGDGGKDDLSVEQVLSHQAGLSGPCTHQCWSPLHLTNVSCKLCRLRSTWLMRGGTLW